MTILDAGDITPKQASALFDVALGEFPFFAECAQAVAYNHSGIISPVRLEGKQRTCGCEVRRAVGHLCNLLLTALNERAREKFKAFTRHYIVERNKFFGQPSPDDRKCLKLPAMEGIARYVHIRSAEAAEHYQPSPEYAAFPDYLSFETYAREARSDTLSELKKADLATWKRTLVYSFGASEGLLLDRLRPNGGTAISGSSSHLIPTLNPVLESVRKSTPAEMGKYWRGLYIEILLPLGPSGSTRGSTEGC